MINMKSGEMTCTLNYVHGFAKRHHVPNIITFDQPLFLEGIGYSARITNGSSTVRTHSMVELPIHVGSNKDSSTIYG